MIKRLLSLSLLALSMGAAAQTAETEVLWTGSYQINWGAADQPTVDAAKCSKIIAGDKIIATFSEIGHPNNWPSIYLRSSANNADLVGAGLWDYATAQMPVKVSIEIPYDMSVVNGFKGGFYAVGAGATLTQIEVEHCGDPTVKIPEGDNVLWFSPKDVLVSWSNAVEISKDKFAKVKAGQYINITVAQFEAGKEWPQLRILSNWQDVASVPLYGEDYANVTFPFDVSFQITPEALALMTQNGLHIDGDGAYINMVTFTDKPTSGVADVIVGAENTATIVYNLQGICVARTNSVREAMDGLHPGIYIVNGKKVIKK